MSIDSAACNARSTPHDAKALPGRKGFADAATFSPPAIAMTFAAQESGAQVRTSRLVASRNTRGLGLSAGTLSVIRCVRSANFCNARSGSRPSAPAKVLRYCGKLSHSGGSIVRTFTPTRSSVSYVDVLRLRARVRVTTTSGLKARKASAPERAEIRRRPGRISGESDSEMAINDSEPSRAMMFSV